MKALPVFHLFIPQDDLSCLQRGRHVDDALIRAALPVQRCIPQRFYIRPIDQHIHLRYAWQVLHILPEIARIQPDGLPGKSLFDLIDQLRNRIAVSGKQRISPAQRDAGDIVLGQFLEISSFAA